MCGALKWSVFIGVRSYDHKALTDCSFVHFGEQNLSLDVIHQAIVWYQMTFL